VRAFHADWYRPTNLVFAATGPLNHDAFVAEVRAAFDGDGAGTPPRRDAPTAPASVARAVNRPGETAHLALGWRALAHEDPDRFALAVANQIVGGGMSSRLFQEIRETRGLAYSVFSSVSSYCDTGVFSVYAGTMPARSAELLAVVDEELTGIVERGVTEQELAVAKGAFEGSTIINLEDTGSRMARLATSMVLRDQVMPIDEYLASIDAVSVDDVRRVAARVFAGAPTIASVGPAAEDHLVS
jgi:predicted Zn-dependent peptidase